MSTTGIRYGQVPHPAFTIRDIPGSINTAWDDLGPRTIRGVVWHRMEGSLWGTDAYFRTGGENGGAARARTDYGIGVLLTDGTANAGKILRWTDPRGKMSPWANGRLSAPYGDGLAFYKRWGVTGINRDLVSIEISGQGKTALDPQARLAIAALTAYWADQYKVPWDVFPQVPGEGRSFVIWHQEFTKGTGKLCPYEVVISETDALVAQAKSILRQYQTQVAPTPTVTPQPIPAEKLVALADAGQIVRAEPRAIPATEQAVLYQYADTRSQVITSLPPVLKGDTVTPKYAVVGSDGRLWYVLDNWARVEAKAFA